MKWFEGFGFDAEARRRGGKRGERARTNAKTRAPRREPRCESRGLWGGDGGGRFPGSYRRLGGSVVGCFSSSRHALPAVLQINSESDSTVVERACATSERIPWSVPVYSALCSGTVIRWAGGPWCRSLAWLPFWRMTTYPRRSSARTRRSADTPRYNFMQLPRESTRP